MDLLLSNHLDLYLRILGCICGIIIQSYPTMGDTSQFYLFGPRHGDTTLPRNDDDSSPQLNLSSKFRFFGRDYRSLWVNTNGLLSMRGKVTTYTPKPFPWDENKPVIAPFWADVDTRRNDPNSFIYYREDISPTGLQRATDDVVEAFGRDFRLFQATWSFIATWYRVTFFGSSSLASTAENTFQVVCVSNSEHTFVFFHYGDIEWTTGTASGGSTSGLGGTPAQVGFDAGDGANYRNVHSSRTSDIVNIRGTFSYRIDGSTIIDNGCASNGVLSLTPRSASFLGGIIVTVAGPCFTPREQVTLDFLDNTGEYNNNIVCEYVSETKVTCFLEALDTLGLQQVRLSTPGDNADEVYVIGYSTFQVLPDMSAEQSVIDSGISSNGLPNLTWDPDFFGRVRAVGADLIFNRISLSGDEVEHQRFTIRQRLDISGGQLELSEDDCNLLVHFSRDLDMTFFGAPYLEHIATGRRLYGEIGPTLWFKSLQLCAILKLRSSSPRSPAVENILNRLDSPAAPNLREGFSLPHEDNITLKWIIENEDQLDAAIFSQDCSTWVTTDLKDFGTINKRSLPAVPCSSAQAERDGSFVVDRTCRSGSAGCSLYHSGQSSSAFNCYHSPSPITVPETKFTNASQQMCYDAHGNLITSLVHGSGNFKSTHPLTKQLPVLHYEKDLLPYLACCKFQPPDCTLCQRYQERRPTDDCTDYEPPTAAQAIGDPHITTIDGYQYTFNGHGQYWLVNSVNLKLQGRTVQYVKPNNQPVGATVWQAFVMKTPDSAVVQVNTNLLNHIEVIVDGLTISFADLADFSVAIKGGHVIHEFGTRLVTVNFNPGIKLEIAESNKLLNIILYLPQAMKGTTSGLMGTWNDDIEDDLSSGDGTGAISLNSSAEEIFNFGWTWSLTEETSLFTYTDAANFAHFHRPQFRPTFTITVPDRHIADEVCGDNEQCLYDLSTTGSVDVAASTAGAVQAFNETLRQLVTVPRCPFLEAPRNGWMTAGLFTEGTNISFHCNDRYYLEGPSYIMCLEGALWDNDPPVCKSPYVNPLQDAKDNQVFLKLHVNGTYLEEYEDLWSNESQALMNSIIPLINEVYNSVMLFGSVTIFNIKKGSLQLWLNLKATSALTIDNKLNLTRILQQAIMDGNGRLGNTYDVMDPVIILVDNGQGHWVEVSTDDLCDVYNISGVCLNGGYCILDDGSMPTCSCRDGYSGLHCDLDLVINTVSGGSENWNKTNYTLLWCLISLGIAVILVGTAVFVLHVVRVSVYDSLKVWV